MFNSAPSQFYLGGSQLFPFSSGSGAHVLAPSPMPISSKSPSYGRSSHQRRPSPMSNDWSTPSAPYQTIERSHAPYQLPPIYPYPSHPLPLVDDCYFVQPWFSFSTFDLNGFEVPRPPPSQPLYEARPTKRNSSHLSPRAKPFIPFHRRATSHERPELIGKISYLNPRSVPVTPCYVPIVKANTTPPGTILRTPPSAELSLGRYHEDLDRCPALLTKGSVGLLESPHVNSTPSAHMTRPPPRKFKLSATAPPFQPRARHCQHLRSTPSTSGSQRGATPGLFLHHQPPEGVPPHSAYCPDGGPSLVKLPLPPVRIGLNGEIEYLEWSRAYELSRNSSDIVDFVSEDVDQFWRQIGDEIHPPGTSIPRWVDQRPQPSRPRAANARYVTWGPLPKSTRTPVILGSQPNPVADTKLEDIPGVDRFDRSFPLRFVPCAPPHEESVPNLSYSSTVSTESESGD